VQLRLRRGGGLRAVVTQRSHLLGAAAYSAPKNTPAELHPRPQSGMGRRQSLRAFWKRRSSWRTGGAGGWLDAARGPHCQILCLRRAWSPRQRRRSLPAVPQRLPGGRGRCSGSGSAVWRQWLPGRCSAYAGLRPRRLELGLTDRRLHQYSHPNYPGFRGVLNSDEVAADADWPCWLCIYFYTPSGGTTLVIPPRPPLPCCTQPLSHGCGLIPCECSAGNANTDHLAQ
jgi:hypothetical protein